MMTLFYTPYRCAHGIPKRIFDRLIAAGGAIALVLLKGSK